MTAYRWFDTHCHLTSDTFSEDVSRVVERSLAKGVGMLTVGGDAESSRRCVELAERYDGVWAAVGVHPNDVAGLDEAGWQAVCGLAARPKTVAIGETGLDYYWKEAAPQDQRKWFRRHIGLALATNKPLSVHARDSVEDMLAELEPWMGKGLKAVWHCFVAGKKDIARALERSVGMGLHLAVGGLATFEDQKPLRNIVARIPDELLLLETDAPYLVPRPREMARNEPWGVIRVSEALAELRGTATDEIAALTTANAKRLFSLDF